MKIDLKYGENPHQRASAEFAESNDPLAIQNFTRLDGGSFVGVETSWISITDLGRLLTLAERFAAAYKKNVHDATPLLAAVVKHGSPCGAAFGGDSAEVAGNTWKGDSQAAFGGFLMTTFPFTKKVASALKEVNADKMPFLSIASPSMDDGIQEYLGIKAGTRYYITNPELSKLTGEVRGYEEKKTVRDLLLTQSAPVFVPDFSAMERHGKVLSGEEERSVFADLSLAYAVASASTSNTVTIVKNGMLIGNAVGQQKRLGSARLALQLAEENDHDVRGAVAVSDSFFPFPDGLEVLADAGIVAVFATSGSVRDKDVFDAAEKSGITLYTVPDKEGRMFAGH